jgi:DnaD/phage-associated family protein
MQEISLRSGKSISFTHVSNEFIDCYMADASGEFVKIYLWLLRCLQSGKCFSLSACADLLHLVESDIIRAIEYWEKKGLLNVARNNEGAITEITILDESSSLDVNLSFHVPDKSYFNGTPGDGQLISELQSLPEHEAHSSYDPEEVKEIFCVAASLKGKPLSSSERQYVMQWINDYHFPPSLIEFIIEKSYNCHHTNFSYMNKVAESYSRLGIRTEDEAKMRDDIHSKTYYTVMNSFGISGRKMSPRETDFVEKWSMKYAFTDDIIGEACQRTLKAIGKISFEYADTILTDWHDNKVSSMNDIRALDRLFNNSKKTEKVQKKNGFKNYKERDLDSDKISEIERKLIK